MSLKNIMPTMYLLIAILLEIVFHFFLPIILIIPPIWNLLGVLPLIVGVVVNLLADKAIKKANTTVKPFQKSTTLITNGVFRISRNPMYLGFALILIGLAVLLRSLSPYAVIIAFVILIQRIFIRVEESMLVEQFGSEWDAYRQETRRWI